LHCLELIKCIWYPKAHKKIFGCIFSEKVILEKGRVATTLFSKLVQVLINTSKVLEGSKNKKEVENDLLSIMAPPKIILSNQFYQDLKLLSELYQYITKRLKEKP
jgi:hypothetical protein